MSSSFAALPADEPEPLPLVRTTLSLRYRHRRNDDEHDDDLFAVVSADVGDANRHSVTGYVMGRAAQDLNGGNSSRSSFGSLQDTRGGRLDLQLFEGYVDVHGSQGMQVIRVGRQWLSRTPAQVNLDGVLMETGPDDVLGSKLGIYGGMPSHEYESSQRGDRVMGTWLEARPWQGGRVRVDWMSLVDDIGHETRRNDLFGLDVNQITRSPLQLRTRWSWLDSETRDGELGATWNDPDQELLIQASWREQMNTQTDLVNEFDPYSATLQAFEPFTQKRLLMSKGFDGRFTLDGGLDTRELDDSTDEGEFNRDFDRVHMTGTVHDVALEGVSVGLTGERWDSDDNETSSWGLDVTARLEDGLRVSVGSMFDLFKNDYLLDRETERVRTHYARVRYRIDSSRTVSAGLDYEAADLDHYTTFTAKMTWRF
ncbi:MAG: hypothetical protein DRQ55_14880 [Planctomycetota bacterium]|nr:MAG: hypothetical protein DRQ55_14880 [Planctomycetota bacterium]